MWAHRTGRYPRATKRSPALSSKAGATYRGIQDHDKFLLICSASSLRSWWVDNELEEALAKERMSKETVLVPIDSDGEIFSDPPPSDKCTQIK